MNQQPMQMATVPFRGVVRVLVIANVAIWLGLVVVLQNLILGGSQIVELFSLVPARVVNDFWIWQLFTYMFLHAQGVFHILFNMLVLWWFGAELESRWGARFFLTYYLVCGFGAGLIYAVGTLLYALGTGHVLTMNVPLVGASGATYGLLLAYGILFGDRILHFMMLFPMRARYFVMIIGAVELVTLLDSGMGSRVANLAHLGGIVVGYLFLLFVARFRQARSRSGSSSAKRGRRLKLVVNNDRPDPSDPGSGPKYWN